MKEAPDKKIQTITVSDVAFAFGYSTSSFMNELALMGWRVLMNKAERFAFDEQFGSPRKAHERGGLETEPSFAWRHVVAATESDIPAKIVPKVPIKEASDKIMSITASELAVAFGYSTASFMKKLASIGWDVVMNEADRLADAEHFESLQKSRERGQWTEPPLAWRHVVAATESEIPAKTPNKPKLESRKKGYLYVLYDEQTEMCKIGCTRSGSGQRQRAIKSAHASVLVNVLNAKVADRYASEAQCHQQFQADRRNGEWFHTDLVQVVTYVHEKIEWQEIDFADFSTLPQYVNFNKLEKSK